jgi:uncharacterized protein YdaU (DUF1376 family)
VEKNKVAKFPSLPLWTDALIGDTYHLTPAEFGSYLRILIAMWRSPNCRLKDDDAFLGRITGDPRNWKRTKAKLDCYLIRKNGHVLNRRLLAEYNFVSAKVEKARAAGRASALKRLNLDTTDVVVQASTNNPTRTQPTTPTPTPIKKVRKQPSKNEGIILPDYLSEELWNQFLESRKSSRSKATLHAQNLLLAKLGRLKAAGEDPVKVVEQSIESGWKSFFPVSKGGRENGRSNGKIDNSVRGIKGFLGQTGGSTGKNTTGTKKRGRDSGVQAAPGLLKTEN